MKPEENHTASHDATPDDAGLTPPSSRTLAARRWLGRYWITVRTLAFIVLLSTLLRGVLFFTQVDRSSITAEQILRIFVLGFRFDLLVALVIVFPQVLHLTLHSNRKVTGLGSRLGLHGGLLFIIAVMLTLSCAEYLFFDEFESRFNYIAFEYLVYPTEVFSNIWESYPLAWILAGIAVLTLAIYLPMRRGMDPLLHVALPASRRFALLGVTALLMAALWFTTGTGNERISGNRVANECSGNGEYSFVYYAWTNRFDYDAFYITQKLPEAFGRVTRRVVAPTDQLAGNPANPLDRVVATGRPLKHWNVVLMLEESLGSDFIGALGDRRGLTPRFDRLIQQGLLFDQFYATGNRTARALEATLTSLPPIPTESILKRDHSQHVYTLARILRGRGYRSLFVYGGRGLFDGMRSFMLANGFERFVEQSDFAAPTFVSAWGVCDEDIFNRAIDEFDTLETGGKPFFSVVLSVSNHKPYTYPDGRIDRPSSQQTRDNAVKYADWALGEFFAKAATHKFYKDTLFVVMGDHGARVYGSQMFPVSSYRVPVLLIQPGGEAAGTRCSTLASSLDIAPIILGRLGGSYRSVFFGRDALAIEPASAYALMQHNHDLVLMDTAGRMAMLGCPKTEYAYTLNRKTFRLTPAALDPEFQLEAAAFYQTANRLYYDEHYFPSDQPAPALASPIAPPVHAGLP
jgi:phosphoglycerol transferase MdoB-like AlkP superfamily enzyme